jgi:hypothetical protein
MTGGYGYPSEYDMERLVRQTLVAVVPGSPDDWASDASNQRYSRLWRINASA